MVSVARTPGRIARYHAGRGLAYVALGALAGALGSALLSGEVMRAAPWFAAALVAAVYVGMGISLWRGRGLHLFGLPQSALAFLYRRTQGVPEAMGLLSAFLPCGWLHGFLVGAAATQSAARGMLLMALFWLGTLPALSAAPWLMGKLLRPIASRAPRLVAVVLIVAGVATLGLKVSRLYAPGSEKSCHGALN
jgi:sulfite exporter TauE/SafE